MRGLFRSARHAAGRPRAIAFVWLCRVLSAWLVASPIARTLTSFGPTHHPRGDAILFDPGGVWLAEAVRLAYPALRSELRGSAFLLIALAFVALVPHATLLEALDARRPTRLSDAVGRGFGRLTSFALLAGATLAVQGVVLALALFGAAALRERLLSSLSERQSDLTALGVVVFAGAVVLALGVLQDLTRAALVREDAGLLAALRRAFAAARHRTATAAGAWMTTTAVSVVLVVGAAWLAGRIDVSRSGEWRVVLVAIVHQATLLGLVWLRATWLARALGLASEEATRASGDTPEGSGAPADPSPRPSA